MTSKNIFDNLNNFNRNSLNIMEKEIFLGIGFFLYLLKIIDFFFFY